MLLKLYLPKIAKFLLRQNPSLIISTFPLASGLVSKYKIYATLLWRLLVYYLGLLLGGILVVLIKIKAAVK